MRSIGTYRACVLTPNSTFFTPLKAIQRKCFNPIAWCTSCDKWFSTQVRVLFRTREIFRSRKRNINKNMFSPHYEFYFLCSQLSIWAINASFKGKVRSSSNIQIKHTQVKIADIEWRIIWKGSYRNRLSCEIIGFHGCEDSSRGTLGCDAENCCGRIPTFQRSTTQHNRASQQKTMPWGGGVKLRTGFHKVRDMI